MPRKIVYIVGGVYSISGMNQVLTQKINWLARNTDYELHMVLTERPDLPWALHVEPNVKWVNFGINFDELDTMPLARKLWHYRKKQKAYKKALTDYLLDLHADLVVSACRREVNFINDIPDGSHKIGEIHFTRSFYRKFSKPYLPAALCRWISRQWMNSFIRAINRLEYFVTLTQEDSEQWQEVPNRLSIPNPVKRLSDAQSSCEAKRVIACGRYDPVKGYDMLLQAWTIVQTRHPDWRLEIFGGGDRDSYQHLAEDLGLGESVFCNGPVQDIYSEYLKSSVFVMTSRSEGFGLVLVEAMSCGLPVVSFACPCGPRDIITDDQDGILVEKENVEALAQAICQMIEHPEARQQMGARGVEKAKQYAEDSIMPRWVELFNEILGK